MNKMIITVITVILLLLCAGCHDTNNDGQNQYVHQSKTITTMSQHSYTLPPSTYSEYYISVADSIYSSLYESMYPTETTNLYAVSRDTAFNKAAVGADTALAKTETSPVVTSVPQSVLDEEETTETASVVTEATQLTTVPHAPKTTVRHDTAANPNNRFSISADTQLETTTTAETSAEAEESSTQ